MFICLYVLKQHGNEMSHATSLALLQRQLPVFFESGCDAPVLGTKGETWRTKQEDVKAVLFEMFTSQARIDRKTGPDNLGRFEYLQALVTEVQDTDKQGNVTECSIR